MSHLMKLLSVVRKLLERYVNSAEGMLLSVDAVVELNETLPRR